MEAVARASGGVVVHCYVGKDRTGVVSALLLRLAGVTVDAVAADYALSAGRVGPLVSGWIEEADDDVERDFRRRISGAPREGMALTLVGLEERWGGAESYLRTAGLSNRDLVRIRDRLV
jgi:protein-tyrosine phosphatase